MLTIGNGLGQGFRLYHKLDDGTTWYGAGFPGVHYHLFVSLLSEMMGLSVQAENRFVG